MELQSVIDPGVDESGTLRGRSVSGGQPENECAKAGQHHRTDNPI